MKSNSKSIIFIIIFSVLLSYITPTLNNIISKVKYGALSEKEISQEILIESKSFYENLSTKDYLQFIGFYQEHLQPIYNLLDSMNLLFADSILQKNFYIIDEILTTKIDSSIQGTKNKNLNILLSYIDLEYNDITNAIKKIQTSSISKSKKEEEINILFIKNNLNKLQNNLSNIILTFVNRIEQNEEKIAINNFIVDKINTTSNSNLIDNKPYFSLPPELAQDKEKEIFSFLEINPKDPIGLIALTQLYLEMRNISDAKLIFDVFLNRINHFPNNDIELAKRLTHKQINEYYQKNIEADLTNTTLQLEENLNIIIDEDYDIVGSTDEKKILILLPYNSQSIFINQITNQKDSIIDDYTIRDSWKNSSILKINNSANIQQIHLKYTTNDFIQYDEDDGKFQFKYGGLSTSSRLIVKAIVPGSFKITSLETMPSESKLQEDTRVLKWINPILPFKISALGFIGAKFGIAGEFVSFYDLYIRLNFTVLIIVIFFFLDWLTKKSITNIHFKNVSYFIIALITTILILNDIKCVDLLSPLVSKIDSKLMKWTFVFLIFVLAMFLDRKYVDKSKSVRISKAVLEIIIILLFLKLYIQNSDFSNKFQYFILIGVSLIYFWNIIGMISKEIHLKKGVLITYIFIIGFVVFFITRNLEFYKFPKEVLDIIGYIFGTVILLLIATCYMASIKEIKNVKNKRIIDRIEERIAIGIGSFAKDTTKLLIVFLIILSFFFKSILIPMIISLFASFFQKNFDNMINRTLNKKVI